MFKGMLVAASVGAALSFSSAAMAGDDGVEGGESARIDALQARVAELESLAAQRQAVDGGESPVAINGFLSAGFARADSPWTYDGGRLDNDLDWAAQSVAGIQVRAQVSRRAHAVTQLVARGDTDFAVDAEWAYLGFAAGAADEIRAGRQRLPLFMLSEYLDVGYARPWATAPVEAYNPDLPSAYDGLSWTHRLERGDWSHEWLAYAGATETGIAGGQFAIDDMAGFAWFAVRGDLTLRAGYAVAQTSYANPMLAGFEMLAGPIADEDGSFGGVGLQYDGERFLVLAEYQRMQVGSWFPDYAQGYATFGVHIGKWMPHLTVADVEVTDKDERYLAALPGACPPVCMDPPANTMPFPADTLNRLLDGDQRSVTVGLRYDFLPNAAAKFDWTHVTDTDGTWGRFAPADGNYFGPVPDEHVDVYRFVVDVVF